MTQTQNIYEMDAAGVTVRQNAFVTKVFGWMAGGLLLTAVIALGVANSPGILRLVYGNPGVLIGLIIGELVLVVALSAGINRMSAGVATGLFLLYAAVNGVTLAFVFLMYTKASIATTFFVTAGTFGTMCVYGYVTKRDLTSLGSLCFMGLIGLIIGSVVNLFWANETLYWLVTYAGVLVFVGLTAYDTQKIKRMGLAIGSDGPAAQKAAVLGALAIYLDFINLFLLLLRILGRRR